MGLLSTLKWKLTPADKKLAILKKRGLTIGGGCEILNGYELGSEPWLVTIGDNCHIGMNAMILPGVTIGRDCIVGACAVVTHDVPDGTVVAGVPARPICTVEEYRDKHANELLMTKHMSRDEKRAHVEAHLPN